jgi:hypothetical protein
VKFADAKRARFRCRRRPCPGIAASSSPVATSSRLPLDSGRARSRRSSGVHQHGIPFGRADSRPLYVHWRERVAAASMDGASARDSLFCTSGVRSRHARERVYALDDVESACDEALASGRLQMEVAGPQWRRLDRVHGSVPSAGAEAPLRVHDLRRRPLPRASSRRIAVAPDPGTHRRSRPRKRDSGRRLLSVSPQLPTSRTTTGNDRAEPGHASSSLCSCRSA